MATTSTDETRKAAHPSCLGLGGEDLELRGPDVGRPAGRWSCSPCPLSFVCRDDGIGGAREGGSGLRGIADRAEAVGGSLGVLSVPGGGTTIEAVVPCAS
jgi:hypothetical protein